MARFLRWLAILGLASLSIATFLLALGFSGSFFGMVTPPQDRGVTFGFLTIWAVIIVPWLLIVWIIKSARPGKNTD